LEVGKIADLCAFPTGDVAPVFDPEAHTVLALPGTRAVLVTVAGRELVRDSKVLHHDPALTERVQRTADALGHWLRSESGRNVP
jgi:cytosine/adenosine deaminase-related metal-dependent hydrolase